VENPAVVGYRIHYAVVGAKHTQAVEVTGRQTTSVVIDNLKQGKTYYFAATSYNDRGKESAYGNVVSNSRKKIPGRFPFGKGVSPAAPGKVSAPPSPPAEKNGPAEGGGPVKKKISHSKLVPKTPEGKIMRSR
jgi:hypothetical protein